ncbi:MAG: sigma-70 family RNA polymerase sigma factor [Cyanobacteria bacterium P01_A01_bin.84]
MTAQKPIDETQLIIQIAQGDQKALSTLYDRYARPIYSLVLKMLNSVEESEEIVLDVFSQVWRTAQNYNIERGRVDTWLFMMARSRSLDRMRSKQRKANTISISNETDDIKIASNSTLPEEDLLIKERRGRIIVALYEIPPEQRETIELAYFQGLTQKEIAEKTGVSLGTVKTRIRLALSKLKSMLQTL